LNSYNYPPLVPRSRSLRHALQAVHNPIPFLTGNIRDYGKTYTFHMGGFKKGVVSIDPAFIRHVLQQNHRNYRKSAMQTEILGHYIGKGLLTADGGFWLRQRRMIQPAFHRDKLNELVGVMHDEIVRFFETNWANGSVRDIYQDMHELAFRIIARAMFSSELDEEFVQRISDKITRVQKFVVNRIRQPYLHWWFSISGQFGKYDKLAGSIRQELLAIVRQRQREGVNEERGDLLDMLLATRYEDTGEPMPESQLVDEVLILFVAGHETSANALSWALYLLAKHPGYADKIRHEAQDKYDSIGEVLAKDTTRKVIEETMRLYPPAWIVDRLSNKEDAIGEFSFRADTFLVLFLYGMHHDPDLWPEPEKFDPERFSDENKANHIPHSYLPFGSGPRLCIGHQFAMVEMILALLTACSRFSITLVDEEVRLRPMITLKPEEPMRMQVSRRAN